MVKMEVIDVIAFFFATQLYLNFIFFCKIQASAFFSSQHFFVVGLCSGCVWFAAFGLGVFSPPKSHSGGGDPALCPQGSGTRGAPPPPSPPPWTARRRCWRAATAASWPEPCFGRVPLCPPVGVLCVRCISLCAFISDGEGILSLHWMPRHRSHWSKPLSRAEG